MHTAIESVPRFRMLLQSLQNLHTIHLAHSDHQIGKLLRQDGVMLPGIRTLVIQGHCYNLLRCCPNVTTVWCIEGDGTKLVPNMRQYCKKVEELRGFGGDGTILVGQYKSRKAKNPVKALISAVPHLRVFEVWDTNYSVSVTPIHHPSGSTEPDDIHSYFTNIFRNSRNSILSLSKPPRLTLTHLRMFRHVLKTLDDGLINSKHQTPTRKYFFKSA